MKKIKKYSNIEMDDFRRYHSGEMTGSERNSFERKLQKDQFSEDSMEGFATISSGELESDLTELQKRLGRRIRGRRISLFYRIAASVAVLMIISSIFIVLQRNETQPDATRETPAVIFDIAKAEPVYNPDAPKKEKQVMASEEKPGAGERTRESRADTYPDVLEPAAPDEPVPEEKQEQKQEEMLAVNEVRNEAESRATEFEDKASGAVAASRQAAAVRSKSMNEAVMDKPPLPEGGMEAFNKYIREKTGTLTPGQSVIVVTAFIVKNYGVPDSIRVLKSPSKRYADEAIKLIRSGPAWNPAIRNGKVAEEEVEVSVELPVK